MNQFKKNELPSHGRFKSGCSLRVLGIIVVIAIFAIALSSCSPEMKLAWKSAPKAYFNNPIPMSTYRGGYIYTYHSDGSRSRTYIPYSRW